MVTITMYVLGGLVVVLGFSYLTGKGKPSDQRSGLQKIACSLMSIFRTKVDETAGSIRSARVMRDEAMHEVEDAINNLKKTYEEGQIKMRTALRGLQTETLPRLKDMPGTLEGKARKAKRSYQESVEKGTPIEAYKQNALKYLQHKAKAMANIKRTEDNITKLEVAIETSKAKYDGNITDLEMIKSELLSVVDIPQIELNQSLARISSLQHEISDAVLASEVRAEVTADINNNDTAIYTNDFDDEFNKL